MELFRRNIKKSIKLSENALKFGGIYTGKYRGMEDIEIL